MDRQVEEQKRVETKNKFKGEQRKHTMKGGQAEVIGRKKHDGSESMDHCASVFFSSSSSGLDADTISHQRKRVARRVMQECRQVHFQLCATDVGGRRDGS